VGDPHDRDAAQAAWVLRETDHDDREAFMAGWDAATAEVERLREALAMTGTEAVNLRVRVIEERAIAAERERIKREVKTVRLMQADYVIRAMNGITRTPQTPADWVEAYRAAVLRIIDGEAEA
jgi:hypothetical protein